MAHSLTIFFQLTVGTRDKELSHISLSILTCNAVGPWVVLILVPLWEENKGLQIIQRSLSGYGFLSVAKYEILIGQSKNIQKINLNECL